MTAPTYLPERPTREDYIALLEGHVPLTEERTTLFGDPPLVRTYMLEMIHKGMENCSLRKIFPEGVSLEDLDDSLFRVRDSREHGGQIIGLLELLKGRYPVFYTTLQAKHSDRWVSKIVDDTPRLDQVWFSPQIL